ncbi:hypothetical protein [Geminicoccus flavidas]|uniref:hypothetical protein n=1 Tax=Geminicoccus flavidas TaxID=2506407 RepID=UPI001357EF62|nr:hypothetical protein [Geminicoccus flavidas]
MTRGPDGPPPLRRLHLQLVPLRNDLGDGHDVGLEISIDGRTLVDWLRPIETRFDPKVAGAYAPASLEYLRLVALRGDGRQVFAPPGVFGSGGTVLVCGCGHAGCWSLDVEVRHDGSVVRWTGFNSTLSSRRSGWSYAAIEPMLFDSAAYFKTLARIAPLVGSILKKRPRLASR